MSTQGLVKQFSVGEIEGYLRFLQEDELDQLHELVREVGWHIPFPDLQCHYKIQPKAFIGFFNRAGTLICELNNFYLYI